MAHIVWLKNPRRAKVVYECKSLDGKTRKRKSRNFSPDIPLRDIKAFMRKMEDLYERSDGIYYEKKTVAEAIDLFMEVYGPTLSPSTYRSYTSSFFAEPYGIKANLGGLEIKAVRLEHVQNFCNKLVESGKSSKTISNRIHLVHTLFDRLRKMGYLERDAINPAEDVRLPRKTTKKIEAYDFDEIHLLLRLVDEYGNPYLKLQAWLGLFCGLRRSEMACINIFKSIDYEKGVLHISQALVRGIDGDHIKNTKSEASIRDIPLTQDMLDLLKARKREYQTNRLKYGREFEDSGFLFSDEYGRRYTVSSLTGRWARFQEYAEKRGLRKLPLHSLRHSFATNLLSSNVPIKVASSLLGHTSYKMTADTYASALNSDKVMAVEMMDKLIKSRAQ